MSKNRLCPYVEAMTIHLGLCCINTGLRKKGVFCSRTVTRRLFTVERAKDLALQNIADISALIEWNADNDIHCLRLSSDIFPHYTDDSTEPYTMDFAVDALRKAGETARRHHQRIVMHPGQYNQVGAKSKEVFEKTCRELEMHAQILDEMGVGVDGVLCVHGGGVYGDKDATIERWINQFELLPERVKRRLAIENCERCYSVENCLSIADRCQIPLIFDTHHYDCFAKIYPESPLHKTDVREWIPQILETWKRRGITPLFHISEQRPDARIGAHSDYIETIPKYLLEIPERYGVSLDIEVEAKMKELAILHLYERYPEFFPERIL